jgi:DNA (cytosine-5)-methyltransferase 1
VDSTQNIISFCTGYGGLELGIRRAGVDVRTIVNVEIEAFCCANMAAKIEEGRMDNAPIWTDLKTFPAREFRGKVHGLIGGYPCQPFSSAGKRKGEKDPRHLWPYILKHVRAIRPVWCFWENVAGHTTMGLWRVLSDLEEEGYRVETGIFSAEEVGAPHQRKRVFILGNSTSKRPRGGSENCEGEQSEVLGERLESDAELANPTSRQPRQSQARNGGQDTSGGSEETQWPARPGEEQYEWEEPRVTEAQSQLGGATHGTQHRVDRLRLLGNGVVPQTAELAWKTLWKELNAQ